MQSDDSLHAATVPSPPSSLPVEIRDELKTLEALADEELIRVASETMQPEDSPTVYQPGDVTDRLALRKAYALVLLKWRGHSVDEIKQFVG